MLEVDNGDYKQKIISVPMYAIKSLAKLGDAQKYKERDKLAQRYSLYIANRDYTEADIVIADVQKDTLRRSYSNEPNYLNFYFDDDNYKLRGLGIGKNQPYKEEEQLIKILTAKYESKLTYDQNCILQHCDEYEEWRNRP